MGVKYAFLHLYNTGYVFHGMVGRWKMESDANDYSALGNNVVDSLVSFDYD